MSEEISSAGASDEAVRNENEASASNAGEVNGEGDGGNNSSPSAVESAASNGNEQPQSSTVRSAENPPVKKVKITKEAEHLITSIPEKEKESIALLKTPAELVACFR